MIYWRVQPLAQRGKRIRYMKTKFAILSLLFITSFSFVPAAFGAGATDAIKSGLGQASEKAGLTEKDDITKEDGSQKKITAIISGVIRTVVQILGVISVILIVYAGGMWLTAAGNETKVTTAKKILVSTLLGVIIVGLAYSITFFVIAQLLL